MRIVVGLCPVIWALSLSLVYTAGAQEPCDFSPDPPEPNCEFCSIGQTCIWRCAIEAWQCVFPDELFEYPPNSGNFVHISCQD